MEWAALTSVSSSRPQDNQKRIMTCQNNLDVNSGIREISDSVYSFTLGEGNHPMFVIGDDGVAAKAIRPALPK
jgi:hypothetical protein